MSHSTDTRKSLMSHLSRGLLYSAPLMVVAATGAGQAMAAETDPAERLAADQEITEQTVVAEAEGEGEGEGEGEAEGEGEGEGEGEAEG
ncbi:MAG: hypothetical protein ACQET4_15920 [Pseudomonadota bacterium]